jgi:hypothetical protein
MKPYIIFSIYALSSLFSHASHAEQDSQQQLSQHPYWRILLRYDSQHHNQWQSSINQANFFISPHGKTNPEAELQATLQALLHPDNTLKADETVECRFPARSAWLRQQLKISPNTLPIKTCPALDTWLKGINPHQATLVFAADFTNNPSSMFGHTLLRIDSPEHTEDTRLLAYAVNYAAQTNTANGLEFAYKGLTGGYAGAFSILPYYEKVKEYNDFENRDLWEYQLNLTPEEITQGLKHLWEIKSVNFPYYFLSSNCSYQLLGLLEAARPNTYLRQDFPVYVIPTDTLRRVLAEKNILTQLVYRPASGTTLAYQARNNRPEINQTAKKLAQIPDIDLGHLSTLEQARSYELAYDYLYYQFLAHKTDKDTANARLRQLLLKRSQYQLPDQRQNPPRPAVDPASGHATTRLMLGLGQVQQQDVIYAEWRPAYQDLLDSDDGYRRGAAIDFLRLNIGYNLSEDKPKLFNFTLLNIDSLATGHDFIRPLSWSFALGAEQAALDYQGQFSKNEQHTVAYIRGGAGLSTQFNSDNWLCYSLAQGNLQAGKALEAGWRVGAGAKLGCRHQSAYGQLLTEIQAMYYNDHQHLQTTSSFGYQFNINHQYSLRLMLQKQQQQSQDWSSININWVGYF